MKTFYGNRRLVIMSVSLFLAALPCRAVSQKLNPHEPSAQHNEKLNSFSYELGKNGFIHNIVFDHTFSSGKTGVRAFTGSNLGRHNIAFLAGGGAYFVAGNRNDQLELGIDLAYFHHDIVSDDQVGAGFVYPDRQLSTLYSSSNLGYRHKGRNTLFRIGFSPGLIQKEFIPGGYLSFGFRFKGKLHRR